MIRRFVRSVIHNAKVTAVHASHPIALRMDPVLIRAMEVVPFEEVEVVNVAGDRFTTWVEEGAAGEVRVHGHMRVGDVITILSHGLLHDGQTLAHRPRVVTLGTDNVIMSIAET